LGLECALKQNNSVLSKAKEQVVNVSITEAKTGQLVVTLLVVLKGMNYTPSEEEYFVEAWRCAVEDNAVDQNRRAEYSFQLVHP
jgi:hypothetical protein